MNNLDLIRSEIIVIMEGAGILPPEPDTLDVSQLVEIVYRDSGMESPAAEYREEISELYKERNSLRHEIGIARNERETAQKALEQIRCDMDCNSVSLTDQRDAAREEMNRARDNAGEYAETAETARDERDAAHTLLEEACTEIIRLTECLETTQTKAEQYRDIAIGGTTGFEELLKTIREMKVLHEEYRTRKTEGLRNAITKLANISMHDTDS